MVIKTQFFAWILTAAVMTASASEVPLIDEGIFLEEADGLLKLDKKADIWLFVPEETVQMTANLTFPVGEPLPMLPCAVLEQMTKLAGDQKQLPVRLWAVFTKYHEKNFLFSVYFLPIGGDAATVEPQPEPEPTEDNTQEKPAEKDASDSIIPEDILKQIRSTKTPDLKKFEQIARVSGDMNLIGRAGYLQMQDGVRVFHPDGFGRNVNQHSFALLPNQMRADAEEQMAQTPGRQRYTVSGLITTYQGQKYMLLRRAQRTFSHGNFTP